MRWRLLFKISSFWIGIHYSKFHKRVCINLLPCFTICITAKDEALPGEELRYTYKRLVGEVYNDSGSNLILFSRLNDKVWFEDPYAVFTSQSLGTSFAQYSLPSVIPAGCTEISYETGVASNVGSVQVLSPDSTIRFETTIANFRNAIWGFQGPTGSHDSDQHTMKHLGATSIYARGNYNSPVANQNLHVWGYQLIR